MNGWQCQQQQQQHLITEYNADMYTLSRKRTHTHTQRWQLFGVLNEFLPEEKQEEGKKTYYSCCRF